MLSAAENVGIPLRITGMRPADRDQRVAMMMEIVGLSEHAAHRPDELSGGQQQRIAIARGSGWRRRLSPTSRPASSTWRPAGRFMRLLLTVVRSEGITGLVATHDEALMDLADEVLRRLDVARPGDLHDLGGDPSGPVPRPSLPVRPVADVLLVEGELRAAGLPSSAGQKREESEVSTSSPSTSVPSESQPSSILVSAMMTPRAAASSEPRR